MSITINTLNNSAGTAKTFAKIGNDRNTSEHVNTTDSNNGFDSRLFIKTTQTGPKGGRKARRSLVSVILRAPSYMDAGARVPEETVTVNMTITASELPGNPTIGAPQWKDAVAYVRNLLTDAVVVQLMRGEV